MKRATGLFPKIADRENLRLAFYRAIRGKRDRADVRDFASRLEYNLQQLSAELLGGNLVVGGSVQFTIHDPKRRVITAPCFRERVLHHAIMNVCEPVFERFLIEDTYACRRGKGRIAALRRARYFSSRFSAGLKTDIRKYFDSISHVVLISLLERRFKDQRLMNLLIRIIQSYHTEPGRGLPIGSLTSQHLANFYLARFDRFVKQTLGRRGYVRYMDDCVVWGETGSELRAILESCREFLQNELRLQIKPHALVRATRHGLPLLGCRVFPTHMVLNRRSRNRFRRRLRELEEEYLAGAIDELALQSRGTALLSFAQADGTKSWQFRTRVLKTSLVSSQWAPTG